MERFRPKKHATLCMIIQNGKILLGMKKRGNMAAFNRELQERLVNDPQIQRYQLERRLLFSITQQARAALTAETRRTIRASITEGQRQAFFQAA